jgi:hypothetical protein
MATSLSTSAMLDPWESLKVNERRQLLGGVNALNGNGNAQIELYDISGNCLNPQLLTDKSVGSDDGTGQYVAAVRGHEGNFAPDGLTYYGANLGAGYIYPIDISNTTKPRMMTQYFTAPGRVHGMAFSDDGNRGYIAIAGQGGAARAVGTPPNNGLLIIDTSEIQARKPDPQIRAISVVAWDDGSGAQHTIPIVVKGKPYVVQVDEGGGGGSNAAGWAAACAANLAPWNMARIVDSQRRDQAVCCLQADAGAYDPKNCDKVVPDLTGTGVSGFTYGAHYCSVDNKKKATTLACGYFESGIRVFDIRDIARPREIAYYNPPSVTTPSPRLAKQHHRCQRPSRSLLCAGSSRRGDRQPADDLSGQRLPVAQVHQRRVAVPESTTPPGSKTEIAARSFAIDKGSGVSPEPFFYYKKQEGALMNFRATPHRFPKVLSLAIACAASALLWGCGGDDEDVAVADTNGFGMVKATCGAGSTPDRRFKVRFRRQCACRVASRARAAICSSSARAGTMAEAGSTTGSPTRPATSATTTTRRYRPPIAPTSVWPSSTPPTRGAEIREVARNRVDARPVGVAQGQ